MEKCLPLPGNKPRPFCLVLLRPSHYIGKGKAVPLQAWTFSEGSRKLRFPYFMTTAQDGGKVVSLTHRPPLPPGNAPGAQVTICCCLMKHKNSWNIEETEKDGHWCHTSCGYTRSREHRPYCVRHMGTIVKICGLSC